MANTDPCIVLVDPQMGENIGAAARAMFNFGLIDLRLVRPRDGWPNERADAMSAGALEAIPPVRVYDTLPQAIADCHYAMATTARERDMAKPVLTPREAATQTAALQKKDGRTAFVFGAERTGLTNDDIALCPALVTIPVNPDFSSLNLGSAVLLMAYEWRQAAIGATPIPMDERNTPAPHDKLHGLFVRMEAELDDAYFFRNPDQRPSIVRNMQNLLGRAQMTDQEIRTFHGMITALRGKKAE